jgi:hypothetical protein
MSFEHFHNICFETLQVAAKGLPLEEVIVDILKGKWDHERTKFSLPPLMTLVRILKFTIYCNLYVFANVNMILCYACRYYLDREIN